MTAEAGNRSQQHRLNSLPFTDFTRDVAGNARIRWLLHKAEGFAHAIFRKDIQVWRLTKLNGQSLLQGSVKHRIAGAVNKISQQNLVLVCQSHSLAKVEKINR